MTSQVRQFTVITRRDLAALIATDRRHTGRGDRPSLLTRTVQEGGPYARGVLRTVGRYGYRAPRHGLHRLGFAIRIWVFISFMPASRGIILDLRSSTALALNGPRTVTVAETSRQSLSCRFRKGVGLNRLFCRGNA